MLRPYQAGHGRKRRLMPVSLPAYFSAPTVKPAMKRSTKRL
jgi:hypothetical protein